MENTVNLILGNQNYLCQKSAILHITLGDSLKKQTNKKTNSLCTYKIEFKPLLDIEDVHLLIQPSPLQSLEALTVPCQGWAPDCYVVRQNFCSVMCSSLRSPSGLAKSPFFKPKFKCLCSFLSFIIIDKVILFYAPTALYVFTISVISLLFM